MPDALKIYSNIIMYYVSHHKVCFFAVLYSSSEACKAVSAKGICNIENFSVDSVDIYWFNFLFSQVITTETIHRSK